MKPKCTFRAVIESSGKGGAFVRIPFNVEDVFGKKRLPVKVTIDGEPYRGTLVRMGEPCHILGVLKGIRTRIGKDVGDEVDVILEEDTELRQVEIPPDLQSALQGQVDMLKSFESLSYTHQKEYVAWIEEAKRAETRATRIGKTIEMLKQGKKGV